MDSWIEGASSLILDRSVEELFVAMIVALVLSSIGAWVGLRISRSKADATTRMTCVMLVVTLLGMVVSGSFIERRYRAELVAPDVAQIERARSYFDRPPVPVERSPLFRRMQGVLDLDGDGRTSHDEMRTASEQLGTDRYHVSGPPRTSGEWFPPEG